MMPMHAHSLRSLEGKLLFSSKIGSVCTCRHILRSRLALLRQRSQRQLQRRRRARRQDSPKDAPEVEKKDEL